MTSITNERPSFFPNSKKNIASSSTGNSKNSKLSSLPDIPEPSKVAKKIHGVKVDLTPSPKSLESVKSAVQKAETMAKEDKINSLKTRIENNNYNIDFDALADSIIEKELNK